MKRIQARDMAPGNVVKFKLDDGAPYECEVVSIEREGRYMLMRDRHDAFLFLPMESLDRVS